MIPYLVMVILYLVVAVLAALDAALTSFQILPWFNGLRWLRIHFITLGALTEVAFGLMPILAAARAGRERPAIRWDIWLLLNAGLLILIVGIPLYSYPLILTGGTLVFVAGALLMQQLAGYKPRPVPAAQRQPEGTPSGRKFYIGGLAYLLLGIIVGTGLWFGWGEALRIAVPIEVHIHANNWGFMSMLFAGLVADMYPRLTGQKLPWPRSFEAIFWLMLFGTLGLVIGPWTKSNWFSVPGLILHLAGTVLLLANMIQPVFRNRAARTPGAAHMITAYAWQLAPVLVAPLIIANVPGFPGAGIEANAPQALIYGWVLQFGFALIPYLFYRLFQPEQEAKAGGSWLSLVAVHLGGAFLWASIFLKDYSALLLGLAYALWTLSMLPIVGQVWQIVQAGLEKHPESELVKVEDTHAPAD